MSEVDDRTSLSRRTQHLDLLRQPGYGVVSALEGSVLLTIAIKQFDAPSWSKGLIAAGSGIGLLAAPFATAGARRSGRSAMHLAAGLLVVSALAMAFAATGSLIALVAGSMVALAAMNTSIPLMTVTYERNFAADERGKRVGQTLALKVLTATIFGWWIGRVLTDRIDLWWLAPVVGAASFATIAAAGRMIPSAPLERVPGLRNRPLPHFHLLADDRRLRLTLSSWMLMGFANLMLLPLRVEFLASDEYGVHATPGEIAMYTIAIPNVVRLVTLPLFGRVFDRISFFAARIGANLAFAAYIAAFFTGTTRVGLWVGALLFGVAQGAGDLMWSLWVTKFAPPGRTADYMGLHTFFTGIRAVIAPLVGFAIVGPLGLTQVALVAVGLMLFATLMLVPEVRAERTARWSVVGGDGLGG